MFTREAVAIPEWPGLSPAAFLKRQQRHAPPFPISAYHRFDFFRARNAIYHLIRSLGLPRGATVLVPDYHSGSEVRAVRAAGASVRFFPIGRDLQPDLDVVKRLCDSTKPRALLTIHYNGWSQPIDALVRLCAERGIALIEDCAHALLSTNGGRPLGTYGDYSVFCLYKSLPVPNGGILVCNNTAPKPLQDLRLEGGRMLSVTGRTAELALTWLRSRAPRIGSSMLSVKRTGGRILDAVHLHRLPIGEVGFDLRGVDAPISPLSLSLLDTFDYQDIVEKRCRNFAHLRARLSGHVALVRDDLPDGMCPLFFPFIADEKVRMAAMLRARGVGVLETWNYGDVEAHDFEFGEAQFLRDHVLELPIHPDLRIEQLDYAADQVIELTRQ